MKSALLFFALSFAVHAADTESPLRLIRTTDALTPAEEEKALHVPEGFEAHLFASEPMINKPINMTFDERGRLWVSSTVGYPYSADKSRWSDANGSHIADSRDAIKILEDTDGDGKADKVTVFADGLNIPTGVLPWHRPEDKAGCIAWSIPNIWYFADTTGAGVCNKREKLFGPLGYEKDTHGMCSSFRLGLDGWVYATHGFNNTSHFKVLPEHFKAAFPGDKPDTLDLHSGNVYRFRPDGSHVEIWAWGQVNPFGLCWDRYNNLYSADCHSNPLTQLIRGAYYPSFGKPNDGLGYGPVLCDHSHGSTGLCGVLYLDGGVWGSEWDDHMILGNCVTSKVNHDFISFTGSTPKANEAPDFLVSDDPWFRPVDLQLGPDSALYVADFYNKIIGHYEIPLDHPGRDKERGRIWRITKQGHTLTNTDFSAMDAKALAGEMASPNITRRRLALGEVKQRGTKEWIADFMPVFHDWQKLKPEGDSSPPGAGAQNTEPNDHMGSTWFDLRDLKAASSLWALSYLGERLRMAEVMRAYHAGGSWVKDEPGSQDGLIMSQATQILGGYEHLHPWEKWCLGIVFEGRGSAAGRAAAQVLLHRPDFLQGEDQRWQGDTVADLMQLYSNMHTPRVPPYPWENMGDSQYLHAMRILLRDFWSQPGILANPTVKKRFHEELKNPVSRDWIVEIMRAVQTPEAADFMMARLDDGITGDAATWRHLARNANETALPRAIEKAHAQTKAALQNQIDALVAIHDGLMERGMKPPPSFLTWAAELVDVLLASNARADTQWQSLPHPDFPKSDSPWCLQDRKCADGTAVKVLSSLDQNQKGPEKLTGILRSKEFAAPEKLSFWLCGHDGFPKEKPNQKNQVRLIDASGVVLQTALPPRSDIARQVEWDLAAIKGKPVSLEIVDGDNGTAYAWLGLTRVEPAVVSIDSFSSDNARQRQLRALANMLRFNAAADVRDKLRPYLPPSLAEPVAVSPAERQRLDALIASRVQSFTKATPDATKGAQVFTTNCAVCHQIKGQGGLIGPQLDGIGNRGVDRLMEDVLDPNRNVDANFQMHVIKLLDDSTLSGFTRGEVGQVIIVVDAAGQEHRVSKNEIKEDKTTALSLMPPVFGQTISEPDLDNLMAFLLTKS